MSIVGFLPTIDIPLGGIMSDQDEGRREEDGPFGSGFSEKPNDRGGYHRTLYDRNSNNHISWDTDEDDLYVDGTGHEDDGGSHYQDWGGGD